MNRSMYPCNDCMGFRLSGPTYRLATLPPFNPPSWYANTQSFAIAPYQPPNQTRIQGGGGGKAWLSGLNTSHLGGTCIWGTAVNSLMHRGLGQSPRNFYLFFKISQYSLRVSYPKDCVGPTPVSKADVLQYSISLLRYKLQWRILWYLECSYSSNFLFILILKWFHASWLMSMTTIILHVRRGNY